MYLFQENSTKKYKEPKKNNRTYRRRQQQLTHQESSSHKVPKSASKVSRFKTNHKPGRKVIKKFKIEKVESMKSSRVPFSTERKSPNSRRPQQQLIQSNPIQQAVTQAQNLPIHKQTNSWDRYKFRNS